MGKPAKITADIIINAPHHRLWDVLFNRFGDTFLYNPNLVGSHFTKNNSGELGCERECRLDAKTYIRETIVQVNHLKNFTLDVTGGNMPMVKDMRVEVRLESVAAGTTKVVLHAVITTSPSFMSVLMKSVFKQKLLNMLVGLKYYLETGRPVTKKTFKPVYNRYKRLAFNQSFS